METGMREKGTGFFEQALRRFERVLDYGTRPGMTIEEERDISNANLLFILVFVLGVNMLVEVILFDLDMYTPISIITLSLSVFGMAYSVKSGHPFFPSLVLVVGLSAYFLYLVATGGSKHTSFFWVLVFPFLHFLAFPFRVGIVLFLSVLLGLLVILFAPGHPLLFAEYADVMRYRIVAIYLFVGFAAIASGFVYWRAQQKIGYLMTRIVELSQTDQLTGLFNRRAFLERMNYEIERSVREAFALSLIMFDIDHFKRINDERGHACGDAALKRLAEFARGSLRSQDTIARWGGEEFIVLLPNTEVDGAMVLAETLRSGIEKTAIACNGEEFSLTLSLGVYQFDFEVSADENINCADKLLYQAKTSGRNRVCGPSPVVERQSL